MHGIGNSISGSPSQYQPDVSSFKLCELSLLGYYFTGDGARRDADGHLHITGRVDDVINVKGVRLGTAEVEDIMVGSACMRFRDILLMYSQCRCLISVAFLC